MFLHRSARRWGDQPAMICRDSVLTYRQLDERSSRVANALLGLGLARGDRVAIQSRNAPEMLEIECALYKAGLVKVALNARFTPSEASDIVANCTPRVLFAGPGFMDYSRSTPGFASVETFVAVNGEQAGYLDYEALLAEASDRAPDVRWTHDELAVLHFSSGSTGKPKAAMQSYGNRMASFRKLLMGADARVGSGSLVALLGPITHASGMGMQANLYCGATMVLFDKFDPKHFLAEVERLRITHTTMVPAMLNLLLAEPALETADLSSLVSIGYGAAPMAPARIREAWERIGPILSQGYGASEATSVVARLTIADHAEAIACCPERLASCGRPNAETEVRIVNKEGREVPIGEVGEVVIRGEDVFQGYYGEPEMTASVVRDGFLYTGDLARMDEQGFIYLVDRARDMIISGGFNVYPNEVESVLYQFPGVHEACVIGVPDNVWGERVKAVVTLRAGAAATEAELIAHCRDRLADYKSPRSVDFATDLPKNASGKLSRKAVRESYWQGVERRVN